MGIESPYSVRYILNRIENERSRKAEWLRLTKPHNPFNPTALSLPFVIGAVLLGLPAADNGVIQSLPVALEAFDGTVE
jgi:hypothetical protein